MKAICLPILIAAVALSRSIGGSITPPVQSLPVYGSSNSGKPIYKVFPRITCIAQGELGVVTLTNGTNSVPVNQFEVTYLDFSTLKPVAYVSYNGTFPSVVGATYFVTVAEWVADPRATVSVSWLEEQ